MHVICYQSDSTHNRFDPNFESVFAPVTDDELATLALNPFFQALTSESPVTNLNTLTNADTSVNPIIITSTVQPENFKKKHGRRLLTDEEKAYNKRNKGLNSCCFKRSYR